MADKAFMVPDGFIPAQFSPGFLDVSGPYFLKRQAASTIIGCYIAKQHMNYTGVAHGGFLATLADIALSLQLYNSTDPKMPVATVGMTTNFLGAARLGEWVEADAFIDKIGKRLAFAHCSIMTRDRILMTMTGVFKVTHSPVGEDATA